MSGSLDWPASGPASAELALFLTGLSGRIESTNPHLLRQAENALLDTVGCILFGGGQPWTKAAHRHGLDTGGDGPCTVIGTNRGTTAAMAAFANGAAAHAFELDDVHEEAISHPGAVVVPAALAMAEQVGATSRALLEAIVIGYEAMGRAGIAVGPASHMLGGFHPTSMSGVFGSAAAASRLLGFEAEQLNHAFGIAATLASGTMEFVSSGGMAKRIHAARAAEGGVTAAILVANGLEGAMDGLAGTYGFCRVFTDDPQIHLLTERLGQRWMLDEITVKPYAACSDIHPMIQAAAELRAIHGIIPGRIVRIEAEGPTKAATQNDMDGTVSVMAAQYSAQFNIAAALLADPSDPATYDPTNLADPAFGDLQAKVVSVTAAPEFDETYAWKMGGRVRITLDDGSVLERTVIGQKGSVHSPLTTAELDQKFSRLVGPERAPDLIAAVRGLDTTDLSSLVSMLR
ncbi:MAG: MmgE/PrpD family protein [Actinomycetia bacterium]|nr:MmgE/PrpD family protein [Actinomycetes bacterium]